MCWLFGAENIAFRYLRVWLFLHCPHPSRYKSYQYVNMHKFFVSMTAWTIHQRQHRVLFKFYCVLLILLARKWINKSKSLKCSQLSKIANCLCAWMVLRVWRDPITSAKLWEKLLKKYEKMICYLDIDRSTLIYSKSFAAWINLLNFVKINWVKSLKFFAIVSCSPSNFVNWRQR